LNAILSHASHVVVEVLLENLESDQIKDWNNIGWVILQLSVKSCIELEKMITIDGEDVLLSLANFLKGLDVMWGLVELIISVHVDIVVGSSGECSQELLQALLEVVGVDVGSPQNLSVRGELATSAHVQGSSRQLGLVVMLTWSTHWSSTKLRRMEKSIWIQEAPLTNEVGHLPWRIEH